MKIEVRRWRKNPAKQLTRHYQPDQVPGADKAFRAQPGLAIDAATATMRLNNEDLETKAVRAQTESVTFEVKLTKECISYLLTFPFHRASLVAFTQL